MVATRVVGLLLQLWGGAFVIGWEVSNGTTLGVGAGLFMIGWAFHAWVSSDATQRR
jgi:hypothetical protein